MKKIAIVGHGYVGQAVERFFKDHFDVSVHDPKNGKLGLVFPVADLFVICVPTPQNQDHSVDLSYVEDALKRIPPESLVLIKSTIPPGTADNLNDRFSHKICFSPEYIGEGKYAVNNPNYPHPTDMKKHTFHIFGGDRTNSVRIAEFFKKVTGPEPRYCFTDSTTAELCKYMENSWGATKVTFCNEFFSIAENMGVDYEELRELWLMDGRVERMHTAVFRDSRGFGGKCFPKDVHGIVEQSKILGYEPELLTSVLTVNEKFRALNPKDK